ncbi:MAG: serine/threonine protein kinase, partial [Chloroflexi bacterium]|nr:serine/threonine protein kinase [Chloroflexota bacterium]
MAMQVCPQCGLFHPTSRACPVQLALPSSTAGTPLPPGTLVGGRYRIEAIAHRSNMSTVYRAADIRLSGSVVALKECVVTGLPEGEKAEARAWLAREASLLASLSDRRLPEFRSGFSEGDRHYIAMGCLEGETLEQIVMTRDALPEGQVADWAVELAELLDFLHGQQPPVIFRDLKPAYILIRNSTLALLDFCVARP